MTPRGACYNSYHRMTRITFLIAVIFFLEGRGQGAVVCANCHPEETARYLASPMGLSLGPPSPIAGGRVTHQRSGSTIVIEQRGGKMIHLLSEHGFEAKYDIAYQIGAGLLAQYIPGANSGSAVCRSPATWFREGRLGCFSRLRARSRDRFRPADY